MAERWIKVRLPADFDEGDYVRLANAIWFVTNAALPTEDFVVNVDTRASLDALNEECFDSGSWEKG